jgi:hypothetical protein
VENQETLRIVRRKMRPAFSEGGWTSREKELKPLAAETILWKTKKEIALHFQISERTVTRLMCQQVFPYTKMRNLVRLDLRACDHAFRFFKVEALYEAMKDRSSLSPELDRWSTKSEIAQHFGISYRTMTSLIRRRVVPYVKVGQLVRLELGECDRAFCRAAKKSLIVSSTI